MPGFRRLPLEKMKNCRDLGGFPIAGGGMTAYGKFFRAEIPRSLSEKDREYFKAAGLTDVLDFRGAAELQNIPNDLKSLEGVNYHWCPMFSRQVAPTAMDKKEEEEFKFQGWTTHYIEMLGAYKDWVKDSLNIAAASEGALLFNCTTGKDRTGLFAMLLLGIAGADREDIIADYCVSMVYMHDVYPTLNFPEDMPREIFITAPEYMRGVVEHLEKEYGSIVEYIRSCDVSETVIAKLREKLLAK